MPIEDFELKEELGKGSFGKVVKVIRKEDGDVYAMKQIKLQRLKEKDKKNALNQIRFLASIKHPNVVGYREAFYDEKSQNLCVVMDLANEGDLSAKIKKHIHNKLRIKEDFIWKVAYDLLSGLAQIHQANIIHRDIKPANVFFNDGIAQLGDLNVAKHLKDPFTVTQTGTPYYASPEVWSEEPYNFKSDVWSLGCVLYEMAMLKPPFRADTPEKLYKKILIGDYEKITTAYSKELEDFINKLLIQSQVKRPGTKELLCEKRMLEMSEKYAENDIDKQLLGTIKFPHNLKALNEKLPKPKYEDTKFKTAKIIKFHQDKKEDSKKLISKPSLKVIRSQKLINAENVKGGVPLVRKPKILNKNGSQRLIG